MATASGHSWPSIWRRVLYPHSPFGHVARLSATHKRTVRQSAPTTDPLSRGFRNPGRVPAHLDVAVSYNNVALIYETQGKYENSLEMHTKSLILGGDSHLLVAKTRENMANIYARTGKFNQALEFYKSVLETKICVCGQDSPLVVTSKTRLFSTKRP